MSRTIIFGDIHGCLAEWQELLQKTAATPEDRLISVGDLICKGPQSRKTLDFAMGLPNLQCVLGNHEFHFLKAWKNKNTQSLEKDYQKRALEELGKDLDHYMRWIAAWPAFIDLPECFVIHGGLRPGISLTKQSVSDLCNLRNLDDGTAWHEQYKGEKTVVYGHWARQGLCVKENSIGLDTGCVYGKKLSAVIFPEKKIVQVSAKKVYLAV